MPQPRRSQSRERARREWIAMQIRLWREEFLNPPGLRRRLFNSDCRGHRQQQRRQA
jgi:hypothetical protein